MVLPSIIRTLRAHGCLACLLLLACVFARADAYEPKLLRSDETGVYFEISVGYRLVKSAYLEGAERVDIPGFGSRSGAGEPLLPSRRFLIAVPPDARYALRWTVSSVKPLGQHLLEPVSTPLVGRDDSGALYVSERYTINRGIYDDYPRRPTVEVDEIVHLRHQRVLPIWIHPVSYDPKTGETSIATVIRVEVSFGRPSEDRRGPALEEAYEPVQEPAIWERVLSRSLVNPDQAVKWRVKRRLRLGEADAGASAPPEALAPGPLLKLKVRESGMHRISADVAASAGFPQGEPIGNLHLFKRRYESATLQEQIIDTPFMVHEDTNGVDGIFDGSDALVFYGLRLREDTLQGDPVEKFADHNVYWLGTTGGVPMESRTLRRGFISPDTAVASFEVKDHYEEDNVFCEGTPPGQEDFYYFDYSWKSSLSLPFSAHAVKPGTSLEIQAEFLGASYDRNQRNLRLSIVNSKGDHPLNDASVPRKTVVLYTSQPVPAEEIDAGENTLLIENDPNLGTIEAFVNWFEVHYESLYRASGNALTFHTSTLSGDTSITVTGLSLKNLFLFDITDPYGPKRCTLADSLFTDVGGGFALSFRESLTSQKRYVLTSLEKITEISAGDMVLDTPSDLIGNPLESGVDVLVVSHRDFLDGIQRWVDFRRAQGYKVLVADVEDVYDEFNGGVPGARAVKNFIRHYFERANASFVLLVGDGSEDNKHVHSQSGLNYVPTESFPEHVADGEFNEYQVVTSDKWYTLMDNDYLPGQTDFYPDLIIGRLPAESDEQLADMLDKILRYEQPAASDLWRRRMILMADDAWAYKSLGPATLCHYSVEEGFKIGQEACAQIIESSPWGGFDVVRFYLSDYTDQLHPPGSPCMNPLTATEFVRAEATSAFIGELNAGATLVSIGAHTNRYKICHEILFTCENRYDGRDPLKLANDGKPFVLFGMGCHMSDYALFRETDEKEYTNRPTGDCIHELLLFTKRGAVSTYGSSSFEYLGENNRLCNVIHRVFFDTPQDTFIAHQIPQARWILGEVLLLAEWQNLDMGGAHGGGAVGQVKRYHILGDPLLRIDAGPPRFEVTVNGAPFQSGDLVIGGGESDTIRVEGIISDEVSIEKLVLEIDGIDATDSMTVAPLLDEGLSASRKYQIRFVHKLLPKSYDIVLRASQSPDTTENRYNIVAEFILRVHLDVTLKVNGREVSSGDPVPPKGDYLLELDLPVYVPASQIEVEVDGTPVPDLHFSHPSQQDTTTWLVSFYQELSEGPHSISVIVSGSVVVDFNVHVSLSFGLMQVINYPNPFTTDTYFVYANEVEITRGTIDIFTTSGRKIRRIEIPPNATLPGQNVVHWDGRDFAGDEVANGVYLYVVTVEQRGKRSILRGKMARTE